MRQDPKSLLVLFKGPGQRFSWRLNLQLPTQQTSTNPTELARRKSLEKIFVYVITQVLYTVQCKGGFFGKSRPFISYLQINLNFSLTKYHSRKKKKHTKPCESTNVLLSNKLNHLNCHMKEISQTQKQKLHHYKVSIIMEPTTFQWI